MENAVKVVFGFTTFLATAMARAAPSVNPLPASPLFSLLLQEEGRGGGRCPSATSIENPLPPYGTRFHAGGMTRRTGAEPFGRLPPTTVALKNARNYP